MSESNREPDIYLKDFKIDGKGETKITVENGKMCISGTSPSITAQEVKVKVEVGKVCAGQQSEQADMKQVLEKMDTQDVEARKRWYKGVAIQLLVFGAAIGISIWLQGDAFRVQGVSSWWYSRVGALVIWVVSALFAGAFVEKARRVVKTTQR